MAGRKGTGIGRSGAAKGKDFGKLCNYKYVQGNYIQGRGTVVVIEVLLYVGGVLPVFWGTAHLFPTKSTVDSFGEISADNKRILAMEWVNEGLTLIFIGALVILNTLMELQLQLIYTASAVMLIAMALLSVFTGARTSQLPFKLCPVIFTSAAILILLGSLY